MNPGPATGADWIALLRPSQWVKNAVVLAALVFSLRLLQPEPLLRSLVALVVFCAASSAAYIVNDVVDAERDRCHPQKLGRPVASGRIGAGAACVAAALLGVSALAVAGALGPSFAACVAGFLALQALYTTRLKHVVVLDAVAIAGGFVLRTEAGVVAAGAQMSRWLFLTSFLLALLLVLAKRRHELMLLGSEAAAHRDVLESYRTTPLDLLIGLLAAAVAGVYIQYTLATDVALRFGTTRLWLTAPFVVFGVFRYLFLIYGREQGGDPTGTLLADRPLQVTVALWAAVVIALLYG
ncbi:MAG: decaprenyl-phosphate phosphoribosyltransferase [Deltaproteobacteria bacterium]|nr:decaprenyl-phosphate phosphoribosyltransferase [Deltaproteobacteria bacterium]